MSDRSITVRLFLTCWLVYSLHFATNSVRELFPAMTLGDRMSFDVAQYADFHPDLFVMPDGRGFINNNPGASIVGAAPYALAKPVIDAATNRVNRSRAAAGASAPQYQTNWPMAAEFHRKAYQRGLDVKLALAAGATQALGMAPLSALAVVVMYRLMLTRLGRPRTALWLALLYALATPMLYRSAQLNQNLLTAHCALFAFALLWRPSNADAAPRRPAFLAAGLLCGWAIVCDYSGAVVALCLSLYALLVWLDLPRDGRKAASLLRFAIGVLASLSVLMLYQWHSFGNPLTPAQFYMPPPAHGRPGMGAPDAMLLLRTLFDPAYGLLVASPLLALALFVWVWNVSRASCPRTETDMGKMPMPRADETSATRAEGLLPRRETALAVVLCAGMLLFCSSNGYGYLQFNTGVRHVVPMIPFAFLLSAGVLMRMSPRVGVTLGALCIGWSWCQAMYRDVELGWGILEAPRQVLTHGPMLPWLGTLGRLGYVTSWWIVWLVLAVSACALVLIWRVGRGQSRVVTRNVARASCPCVSRPSWP